MLRFTRKNGDIILVNPSQIAMVEPIYSNTMTRISLSRGEQIDIAQPLEEVTAIILGQPYTPAPGPKEFKGDAPDAVDDAAAPQDEADDSFTIPASAFADEEPADEVPEETPSGKRNRK